MATADMYVCCIDPLDWAPTFLRVDEMYPIISK